MTAPRKGRCATRWLTTWMTAWMTTAALLLSAACRSPAATDPLDVAADRYVQLVAALGQKDPDSVESEGTLASSAIVAVGLPPSTVAADAGALVASLRGGAEPTDVSIAFRRRHLIEQLDALAARATQVTGRALSPADEWTLLLGLAVPAAAVRQVEATGSDRAVLALLSELLPGRGPLNDRVDAFDATFTVAAVRLPRVFERAMRECRERTLANLTLPAGESITTQYVTGRPWSGFSHYLGDGRTRVEVNTGFPLTVDRVLELACHEGYPGHHVYNTLRDQRLVKARGWREFTVMPLFSPESFSSEAAASLAAQMVFTDPERLVFERDVLFPLASLDPTEADRYLRVTRLRERLEHEIAAIVSAYVRGELDVIEAAWALEERALMKHPLATLQFVNKYRGYALAYTLGKAGLAKSLGSAAPSDTRWKNLLDLIETGDSGLRSKESRNAG